MVDGPTAKPGGSLYAALDRWRHRIPFWWWLTYDVLVGVVIVVGTRPGGFAFVLGFVVLSIAVVIDVAEFLVKRPSTRAKLATTNESVPRDYSYCAICGTWPHNSECPDA